MLLNCARIASTAALSAAFASPFPIHFAAAIAATSVTRTNSRARFEYEEARNLQAATEDRIRVIEEQLSHARIIEHPKGNAVSLGSIVSIQKQGEKEEHTYEIVGSAEANMQEHKISHLSPLGSALMDKKRGDMFAFDTPKGAQKYKIVNIK